MTRGYCAPANYGYLACPYTHPDPMIRQDRVDWAAEATAILLTRNLTVVCPIVHGHHLSPYLPEEIQNAEFWASQCAPILHGADYLCVLMLEGWAKSAGVKHEINWALSKCLDIWFFTLDDLRDGVSIPAFSLIAGWEWRFEG